MFVTIVLLFSYEIQISLIALVTAIPQIWLPSTMVFLTASVPEPLLKAPFACQITCREPPPLLSYPKTAHSVSGVTRVTALEQEPNPTAFPAPDPVRTFDSDTNSSDVPRWTPSRL